MSKHKLSVPTSDLTVSTLDANGSTFVSLYNDPLRKIDPTYLLKSARVRLLDDGEKKNYIVIKFSYVLYDRKNHKVALISRSKTRHQRSVGDNSILLSSGLESFYGAQDSGGELMLNSYHPFTRKLGAYVNEFDLPYRKYSELGYPVRYCAFAVRKHKERYYAFFIHIAELQSNARFPSGQFQLLYPDSDPSTPADYIQGFFKIEDAQKLLNDTDFTVDKYALSLISGNDSTFNSDGLESFRFSEEKKVGFISKVWSRIFIRPSFGGVGVEIKKPSDKQ